MDVIDSLNVDRRLGRVDDRPLLFVNTRVNDCLSGHDSLHPFHAN